MYKKLTSTDGDPISYLPLVPTHQSDSLQTHTLHPIAHLHHIYPIQQRNMLASILATVLLVSSVLAAPSPRPGKQTNRRAVASRMTDKANGVVLRQATSARIYPT